MTNKNATAMKWRFLSVFLTGIAVLGLSVTALVLHCRKYALPDVVPPPLRGAASEVRVRARHAVPGVSAVPEGPASDFIRTVCGLDAASADRYEARNNALRSVARRWFSGVPLVGISETFPCALVIYGIIRNIENKYHIYGNVCFLLFVACSNNGCCGSCG